MYILQAIRLGVIEVILQKREITPLGDALAVLALAFKLLLTMPEKGRMVH